MKPAGWITVKQAALLVERTPATIYNWINWGYLKVGTATGPIKIVNAVAVQRVSNEVPIGRPPGTVSHNRRRRPT